MSYPGYSLRESKHSAEMHSVYSLSPLDSADIFCVIDFLEVFYLETVLSYMNDF